MESAYSWNVSRDVQVLSTTTCYGFQFFRCASSWAGDDVWLPGCFIWLGLVYILLDVWWFTGSLGSPIFNVFHLSFITIKLHKISHEFTHNHARAQAHRYATSGDHQRALWMTPDLCLDFSPPRHACAEVDSKNEHFNPIWRRLCLRELETNYYERCLSNDNCIFE